MQQLHVICRSIRENTVSIRRMNGLWIMVLAVGVTAGTRGAAMIAERLTPGVQDLWGFGADAIVGLWVGLILVVLRWRGWATHAPRLVGGGWGGRVAAGLVMAGWVLVGALAVEHVRVLSAWPDVRQAGVLLEPTFVRGSLLSPRHPFGLATAALLCGLAAAVFRSPRRIRELAGCLLLAVVATGGWLLLPRPGAAADWRGTHFVTDNLPRLWALRNEHQAPTGGFADIPVTDEQRAAVDRWFRSDLDGEPLVALPTATTTKPNVLLLIIEGLGGDRVRAVHGLSVDADASPATDDEMPRLNALAAESVVARRFLNQQQQTNRGTYALLAGSLPLLQVASPRMSRYTTLPRTPYLPRALADAGYRTAYLQSADLSFMAKWPFLRHAGFGEVDDAITWTDARVTSGWGVDDVSLMNGAMRKIDSFEAENRQSQPGDSELPWFLTVMTAGTHHPYMVPEDFGRHSGESDKQQAFRYADAAVGAVLDGLAARGLLDETVVVVTSDESGSLEHRGRIPPPLAQFWGLCMVRLPGGAAAVNHQLTGQSDVALTVLDAVGLSDDAAPFAGRSILRHYADPRPLPFAAVYHRRLGIARADGNIELLDEDFHPIALYRSDPASGRDGFAALVEDPAIELGAASDRPLLADLARRQHEEAHAQASRPIVLIPPGRYVINELPAGGHPLTKGQFLHADTDAWVRVDFTARPVTGQTIRHIGIHFLNQQHWIYPEPDGGFTFFREQLRRLDSEGGYFSADIKAFGTPGQPMEIVIDRARVTITPVR